MSVFQFRTAVHSLALSVAFGLSLGSAEAQINSPAPQAVLMDYDTGEVLYCKDCDVQVPPSSMTKLMTAELVFQRLKDGRLSLDDTFLVSERAWRQGQTTNESKMWVELGSQTRVDDLLKGIIVVSGGDACVVVAEALGGTEEHFAEMMTQRAQELGLTNSQYRNSHGIAEDGHHMSVHDIAKLSAHIIREYPDYYHYFAIPEFTWSGITQANRNSLLFRNVGVDGLKTGHTDAGGYGIVASAMRDGRRLVAAVNGLDSENARNAEGGRLLDVGFREFRNYPLVQAGEIVGELEVWGGAESVVPVTVYEPVQTILSPDARKDMRVSLIYEGPIQAPIAAGQQVGTLVVSAPGKPDLNVPLLAAEEVDGAGIFGNMLIGVSALLGGAGD